jgi:farnesyl diphosphate synthase
MAPRPIQEPRQSLESILPSIKSNLTTIMDSILDRNEMSEHVALRVREYYSHCLDYNIVGGKLARAQTVCEALRFCSQSELDSESVQFQAALVLGWTVEILQAFFLIEDDVMDKGETRRGQPCWYKCPGVGIANAINDGLLLEQILYELVEFNEYTKPYALQAQRIIRNAATRTVLGQHLDTHPPTSPLEFTRDQWLSVVRFKTAFYTFVLPCELGILVSGRSFPAKDLAGLRSICLLIGELFQAQDDMLDCFADPSVIGKIGRDIEEGKCTWLWYTAMNVASPDLRERVLCLFSSPSRQTDASIVSEIKSIYRVLKIELEFDEYKSNLSETIKEAINCLESQELKNLSTWLFESTINRKK